MENQKDQPKKRRKMKKNNPKDVKDIKDVNKNNSLQTNEIKLKVPSVSFDSPSMLPMSPKNDGDNMSFLKNTIMGLLSIKAQHEDTIAQKNDENDYKALIKQKALTETEVELVKAYLSEYLRNFVIMGYDMRGERILIASATTSQEKDAVLEMAKMVPMVLHQTFHGPFPPM